MREVKRLRVFGINFDIDESPNGYLVYAHDFDAQAAELAEARELLRACAGELDDWRMSFPDANSTYTDSLLSRVDAFLSK